MDHGWVWRRALVGILILSHVLPIYAWSAEVSLGTARGVRAVEVTLNDGKTWLPLGGRSFPILQGTQIRSRTGSALIELADGSRINILPFNTVQFRQAHGTIEVSLLHGRLTFQLPAEARVEILTPSARLEPVHQESMVGEVFVNGEGVVGLKMTRGALHVRDLTDASDVMLASLDPVFIPQRPAGQGPLFASDAPAAPLSGAKGVFTPNGESIGYLQPDGRLVVRPNFTADLTRPFPNKLIRMAMATIPEERRTETTPLFDVNGNYLGYLSDSDFYPQTSLAQAVEGGSAGGAVGSAVTGTQIAIGAALVGSVGLLAGLGAAGVLGGGGAAPPATPIQPSR